MLLEELVKKLAKYDCTFYEFETVVDDCSAQITKVSEFVSILLQGMKKSSKKSCKSILNTTDSEEIKALQE